MELNMILYPYGSQTLVTNQNETPSMGRGNTQGSEEYRHLMLNALLCLDAYSTQESNASRRKCTNHTLKAKGILRSYVDVSANL